MSDFPTTKTPKGRAAGEKIPGAAALANHRKRHETPGILAQTFTQKRGHSNPDKVKQTLAASTNIASPNNRLAVDQLRKDEAVLENLKKKADPLPDLRVPVPIVVTDQPLRHEVSTPLPPEPAPVKVVTATARVPSMDSKFRIGVAPSGLVIIAEKELTETFGRLEKPKIARVGDQWQFTLEVSRTGFQWSDYHTTKAADGESYLPAVEQRLTITAPHLKLPEGFENFGLVHCEYVYNGEELVIITPKIHKLPAPRKINRKPGGSRSPVVNATEGLGTKFKHRPLTPVEKAEVTAIQTTTLEDIALGSLLAPQLGKPPISGPTIDQKELIACLAFVNNAKRVMGDDLRLYINTATGAISAKIEVILA